MRDTLDIRELLQEGKRRRRSSRFWNYGLLVFFFITIALMTLSGSLIGMTGEMNRLVDDHWASLNLPAAERPKEIRVDTDGSLWLLLDQDTGLWHYKSPNDSWERIDITHMTAYGTYENDRSEISAFDVANGEIWAFRDEDVAHYVDGQWTIDRDAVSSSYAGAAVVINQSQVMMLDYFGTTSYLNRGRWRVMRAEYALPGSEMGDQNYYGTLVGTPDGAFWIAYNGIYRFDGREWNTVLSSEPDQTDETKVVGVTQNRVWVTTIDELLSYTFGATIAERINLHDLGIASGANIYQVGEAGGSSLWMATSEGYFARSGSTWETPPLPLPNSIRETQFAAAPDGSLYVISCINPSSGYRPDASTSSLAALALLTFIGLMVFFFVRAIVMGRRRRQWLTEAYFTLKMTVGTSALENTDPSPTSPLSGQSFVRAVASFVVFAMAAAANPFIDSDPLWSGAIIAFIFFLAYPLIAQLIPALLRAVAGRVSKQHPLDEQPDTATDPTQQPLSSNPMEKLQTAIKAQLHGHYEFAEEIYRSLMPVFWKRRNPWVLSYTLAVLGETLKDRERYDEALPYYTAAIQLIPEGPLPYSWMAEYYQNRPTASEPERALEWASAAVSMLPRFSTGSNAVMVHRIVYAIYALSLANLKRSEETRAAIVQAMRMPQPTDSTVLAALYLFCGRAALAIGDTTKGREYLETCATLQPELIMAASARALLGALPVS